MEPAVLAILYPVFGLSPSLNAEMNEKAKNDVSTSLKVIDDYLKLKTFLVGNGVTIADISLGCTLIGAY